MNNKSFDMKHFLATQELLDILEEKIEEYSIDDKEVVRKVKEIRKLEKDFIEKLKGGIK